MQTSPQIVLGKHWMLDHLGEQFQPSRRKARKAKLSEWRRYGTAPAPSTARTSLTTLGYIWIPDGYKTKFTFSANPTLAIYEVEVKPAGVDNGEPIKQDSMWNNRRRIKRPGQLIEGTPATVKGLYDPQFRSQIDALCGIENTITETDYDGGTKAYYGYLQKAEHEPLKEHEPGMSTITIIETDWDYVNRVQAAPVYAFVTGS